MWDLELENVGRVFLFSFSLLLCSAQNKCKRGLLCRFFFCTSGIQIAENQKVNISYDINFNNVKMQLQLLTILLHLC